MYFVINNIFKDPQLKSARLVSPISISTPLPTPQPVETEIPSTNDLASAVQGALQGTHGTYAVVIKNFKTGQSYNFNEHLPFESASLYKLWVMAVVYQEIQNGDLTEDQVLSEDVTTLNKKFQIASEDAELTDGTITLSVKDALHQMITISSNYAALLLTEKVRLSSLDTFLKQYGFSESKVGINGGDPMTTAADIALFYEKLYKDQLANAQYTNEMIDLLKQQALNEKIPNNLPDDIDIAHKTGEIDGFSHDAGIVYAPNGNYIIVVLTKSDMPAVANERIANISEAVYNYFQDQ